MQSILTRSPEDYLEEIILVDDMSDLDHLHDDIQNYLNENSLEKVKLIVTDRREGLIRARLVGARKAQGEVNLQCCLTNALTLQVMLFELSQSF